MQKTQRNITVSIAMSPELARRVRVLAAKENKSRSQFVRELLKRALPADDQQAQVKAVARGDD